MPGGGQAGKTLGYTDLGFEITVRKAEAAPSAENLCIPFLKGMKPSLAKASQNVNKVSSFY